MTLRGRQEFRVKGLRAQARGLEGLFVVPSVMTKMLRLGVSALQHD